MKKVMLIMDEPKKCEDCKVCSVVMGKSYCTPRDVLVFKGEKDCSCPLIAVPDANDKEE